MNPFNWLRRHSPDRVNAEKLYGAIVAQARLPVFYADLRVPDTLEGRLTMLTAHIFAVLRRLKTEGADGLPMAQELMDVFSADMDTVHREIGISDMKVPKRVRDICAKTHGMINVLDEAYTEGEDAFRTALEELLPMPEDEAKAASRDLSAYLQRVAATLTEQPIERLRQGDVHFPEVQ